MKHHEKFNKFLIVKMVNNLQYYVHALHIQNNLILKNFNKMV